MSRTLLHTLASNPSSASTSWETLIKDWTPLGLSVSRLKVGVIDAPRGAVFKDERHEDQEKELNARKALVLPGHLHERVACSCPSLRPRRPPVGLLIYSKMLVPARGIRCQESGPSLF